MLCQICQIVDIEEDLQGNAICEECQPFVVRCYYCQRYVKEADTVITYDENTICRRCCTQHYHHCETCIEDAVETENMHVYEGQCICHSCYCDRVVQDLNDFIDAIMNHAIVSNRSYFKLPADLQIAVHTYEFRQAALRNYTHANYMFLLQPYIATWVCILRPKNLSWEDLQHVPQWYIHKFQPSLLFLIRSYLARNIINADQYAALEYQWVLTIPMQKYPILL